MRSKFDEQLALLNRDQTKMGSLCEEALALAAKALANADGQTAAKIAPIDSEIDQMEAHYRVALFKAFATAAASCERFKTDLSST